MRHKKGVYVGRKEALISSRFTSIGREDSRFWNSISRKEKKKAINTGPCGSNNILHHEYKNSRKSPDAMAVGVGVYTNVSVLRVQGFLEGSEESDHF